LQSLEETPLIGDQVRVSNRTMAGTKNRGILIFLRPQPVELDECVHPGFCAGVLAKGNDCHVHDYVAQENAFIFYPYG